MKKKPPIRPGNRAELVRTLGETRRLRAGGMPWVAYPEGGARAGTDLSREGLWAHLEGLGLTGVTLVALDERRPVMCFRPTA